MSASEMVSLLEGQGFFAGVPERVAAAIGELTSERKAGIGELLFRQGDPADRFFLVKSGLVAIELYAPGRDPIVVEQVYDGDVVGWSWLVPPYRWSFDARAVEPSSLIDIDAAALRERFGVDPILGYEVIRRFVPVMARRLSSARERLVECVTDPS
ncbi:MAG: Crp/Fnr family transcriptional regulator [Candidatus Baltobacteraceae bacterium]